MKTKIGYYNAGWPYCREFIQKIKNFVDMDNILCAIDECKDGDGYEALFVYRKDRIYLQKYAGMSAREIFNSEKWEIYATYHYPDVDKQGYMIDCVCNGIDDKYGSGYCNCIHKYRLMDGLTDPFDRTCLCLETEKAFRKESIDQDMITVDCTDEEYERDYWR